MSDTQWPRFQVLQQLRENQPHENAGTVHAVDGEMALLNARDVFVRRPDCVSLWVVPVEAIFSKTAEELMHWSPTNEIEAGTNQPESYHVFQKLKHVGTHIHMGDVEATNPAQAMKMALERFNEGKPLVWWVFPARAVTRSEADDIESMFAPAYDKDFRSPGFYHTVAQMHEIKKAQEKIED